jgi:hypothetical protein
VLAGLWWVTRTLVNTGLPCKSVDMVSVSAAASMPFVSWIRSNLSVCVAQSDRFETCGMSMLSSLWQNNTIS